MIDWILSYLPAWAAYGLGGTVLAAAAAVWVYLPMFRREAIYAIAVSVGLMWVFHKGQEIGDNIGASRVQRAWDDANERANRDIENSVRAAAERASSGVPDPWDAGAKGRSGK